MMHTLKTVGQSMLVAILAVSAVACSTDEASKGAKPNSLVKSSDAAKAKSEAKPAAPATGTRESSDDDLAVRRSPQTASRAKNALPAGQLGLAQCPDKDYASEGAGGEAPAHCTEQK